MNRPIFADNPSYRRYEEGLQKLNQLIGEGKGDDDEADAVRDEMDFLYRKLTREERDRLSGLSADLYMLLDDEIFERFDGTQEELRAALQDAWKKQEWETLLKLLRKGPDYLSREGLASLRAHAYQSLGHLEVALTFKEYASRLNPQEIGHKAGVLALLFALNRREAAATQARNIIADPGAPSNLVAFAGYVLSQTASPVPEEQGENSFTTARKETVSNLESLLSAA